MKLKIAGTAAIIICGVLILSFKKNKAAVTDTMFEPFAVVELFTSQGCSSCPPADALLARTIADAKTSGKKIFALSFHVDYWNRLGWKDPFSSSNFSQRQKDYVTALNLDGAYTPQMVINGSSQFVGSDNSSLTQSLTKALNTKAAVNFTTLTATYNNNKKITLQYAVEGNFAASKISVALISLTETTVVKRGENGGHTLKNENVVRQWISKDAAATGEIIFENTADLQNENTAVIAFVQQQKDLKITGAAMVKN
jgi:hypothetical protein